jgi:hypothetical protein
VRVLVLSRSNPRRILAGCARPERGAYREKVDIATHSPCVGCTLVLSFTDADTLRLIFFVSMIQRKRVQCL